MAPKPDRRACALRHQQEPTGEQDGTYLAHWGDDDSYETSPVFHHLSEALEWARTRAPSVIVRPWWDDGTEYWAGIHPRRTAIHCYLLHRFNVFLRGGARRQRLRLRPVGQTVASNRVRVRDGGSWTLSGGWGKFGTYACCASSAARSRAAHERTYKCWATQRYGDDPARPAGSPDPHETCHRRTRVTRTPAIANGAASTAADPAPISG